ncbi:Outer membrane channel TolC [Candidatus Bealeia paramacronuclearis]|uniref:Outer membrane channel TolC n=1 Tax=Candidatus Bealeia paramacronuclearis TaxID=1921001 RepID=A0ABZ2C5J3_9PROT|nr:Outer membrane channel TolC [Candidatus Bealeia paramacronuclearis]
MKRALISLSCLLSACAIGPDYEKPEFEVPDVWENAGSQNPERDLKIEAEWWKSFQDPLLTELVEEAVKSNPTYLQALSLIQEARAQVKSATAGLFPEIDGTGSYSHNLNSLNVNSGGSGGKRVRESDAYALGFDTSWEIDLFGRLRRADEAAKATFEGDVANGQDILLSLIAEVAQNYVLLRQYQQQLLVTQKNAKSWDELYNLNVSLFQAGHISEFSVLEAKTSRDQTRSQIAPLEANVKTTLHQLAILTGKPPASLYDKLSEPHPIPQVSGEIFADLPSALLERRPDIRKAERNLASNTAQIGLAMGDLFPKFSFTGNLGYNSSKGSNFFDHTSFNASFGPTFTWDIIDFGRVRANIEAQEAIKDQSYYQYKSVLLSALQDVENGLVNLSSEGKRHENLYAALTASQGVVDLSLSEYQAGVIDFLTVLTAKTVRNTNELNFIQSQAALSVDAIALYKALGGGWETILKSSKPQSTLLSIFPKVSSDPDDPGAL